MPWTTLELDPAQATERDVKRAYAKRLKNCRPDQDPEGFRKLHDAYTAALQELQWRDLTGRVPAAIDDAGLDTVEEDASAGIEAAIPVAEELPAAQAVELSPGLQAITAVFDRIDAAIKDQQPGIASLMREVEAALYLHPAEIMRWGEFMHDLIIRHSDHPEVRLRPEAMLFELEHGGAAATVAIVDRLDRQGSPQGISNLANLLLQNQQRIANPGAGYVAARLAGAAAFWVSRHQGPLADFAYQHLARGERDYHMQFIDRHEAMAKLLYSVPDRFKSYWRQRLMNTPGKDAWADEESREALRWLSNGLTRGSQTFLVLFSLLPDEVAASFDFEAPRSPLMTGDPGTASSGSGETMAWTQGSGSSGSRSSGGSSSRRRKLEHPQYDDRAPKKKRRAETARSGGSWWSGRLIWIPLFFVIRFAMITGASNDPPPPPERTPPSIRP
ncbi:hypothetical protein [Haloferula sp. BvORR071]|uniref:hypothetical protein n=1 Tax=Haloferula sp. BvORR071 TaxID=1396141 RepID=UPI00054FA6AB|nr:hypothetical protein [Haloferula sp. BvORR071]